MSMMFIVYDNVSMKIVYHELKLSSIFDYQFLVAGYLSKFSIIMKKDE